MLYYYNFLKEYHREPIDMEDLVDGIQAIAINREIEIYVNQG